MTENLSPRTEPNKRDKTRGEHVFDVAVYGGFGLGGNEITSKKVMDCLESGGGKSVYTKFSNWFKKFESAPAYIHSGRMPEVLAACIGGMFMVLPIKWMESHKGSAVRWLDSKLYPAKSGGDSHIVEAHKEMDEAPQQTWNSLWKGRVTTVISAVGADSLFGWEDSVMGKLAHKMAPGTVIDRFSTLDGISNETAKFISNRTKFEYKTVKRYTWLFTLSTSLTALFYVTSKMFAKNNADRITEIPLSLAPANSLTDKAASLPDTAAINQTEKPLSQISEATHEAALLPVAQPQRG